MSRCLSPVTLHDKYTKQYYEVPCGKCVACLRKRQREWTCRLSHELRGTPYSLFITLTYDDDHLPEPNSLGYFPLNYYDVQCMLKNLRQNWNPSGAPIKYVCVCEYGDDFFTFRPHYHLLIFNWQVDNENFLYTALNALWNKGIYTVGTLMKARIMYSFKYVFKLQNELADQYGLPRPFMRCSTRPAIGLGWLENETNQHYVEHQLTDKKSIPVLHDGHESFPVPRYYRKRLIPSVPKFSPRYYQKIQELQDLQTVLREKEFKEYGYEGFNERREMIERLSVDRLEKSRKKNRL